MTAKELDEIEARANAGLASWAQSRPTGLVHVAYCLAESVEDVPRLVAEVRRLRSREELAASIITILGDAHWHGKRPPDSVLVDAVEFFKGAV